MPLTRTVLVFFVAALAARPQSAYFSLTGESSFEVLSATTGANTARFITTLRGLNYVTSPDRTIAYVASQYESVVVAVDLETGRRIGTLGPSGVQPAAVAISPDGATLYSANLNNTISIIDVATGATLKTFGIFQIKPDAGVVSLAVTPDGTKAYVGANTFVFPYDLVTGEHYASLGLGGAQRVALSPAGDRLFVPAQIPKKLLDVVDTATDTILFYIPSAGGGANDVDVSADGSTLYIAATKGLIIASAATGTVLATIPSQALKTVALSPNELAACAVSEANPALVLRFDLVSNMVAGVSSAYGTGVECGVSANGNTIFDLLTPDNNLVIQNTVAQNVTRLIAGGAGSPPSISSDGKTLVEPGTNFLAVFDTITKRQVQSAPYSPASKFNLAVSNDGTVAFVPSGLSPFAIDEIDLTSGTVIRSIPLPDAYISDVFVTLSPDGNTLYFLYVAAQGRNYALNLCAADVATGSLQACQQIPSGAFNTGLSTRAIAASGDGSRLYAFTSTQTLGEFDTTLNLLRTLQIPVNYGLISLVFSTSANSLYLAATDSSDMLGMLMRVAPQTFTISSQQSFATPINDVAVSADGSSIYVASPLAASPGVFDGLTLTPVPGAQAPGYSGSVVAGPY